MYSVILLLHVVIGIGALAAYWTAGFARKGSRLHRRAGRVFLQAMVLILATATLFVARMIGQGALAQAAFFAYLIVISATALITGWSALRFKQQPARYFGGWYRALAVCNIACGAGVLALGITQGNPIHMGFSAVGLIRGGSMLRLSMQPASPRWWLREHLGSMIGNGVAVHVAFLLVGLDRLLPAGWQGHTQIIGWLLPLAIAGVAGAVFNRRYAAQPVSASGS